MSTLTDPQLKILLAPVNPRRVGQVQGMAHMEAWDIRRQLIRVFGFGGYSTETLALDLVAEREIKPGRWTIVYRAQVRLTVYDADGNRVGTWDDGAVGDAKNQPSIGDAHDQAMKTALSQALKRCATNLGDQFGLSLYNNGSPEAVVNWSAAHPPKAEEQHTAPPAVLDADPQVQPEPQPQPPVAVDSPPQEAPQQPDPAPVREDPDERDAALAAMWDAARDINFIDGLPKQFVDSFGHPIEQGTTAEYREAYRLMTGSAAA